MFHSKGQKLIPRSSGKGKFIPGTQESHGTGGKKWRMGCLMAVHLVSQPMLWAWHCVELYIHALTLTTALRGKDKSLHLQVVAIGAPKSKLAYIIT